LFIFLKKSEKEYIFQLLFMLFVSFCNIFFSFYLFLKRGWKPECPE